MCFSTVFELHTSHFETALKDSFHVFSLFIGPKFHKPSIACASPRRLNIIFPYCYCSLASDSFYDHDCHDLFFIGSLYYSFSPRLPPWSARLLSEFVVLGR